MKKFNEWRMMGDTEDDNKAILEALDNEIPLFVDNDGRVWTEGGQRIADCHDVEAGCGIGC